MSFQVWLNQVDKVLRGICGLTHNDLADQTWFDWFRSGMTPAEAANECLADEGFPFGDE
jgi:hypothetical protein